MWLAVGLQGLSETLVEFHSPFRCRGVDLARPIEGLLRHAELFGDFGRKSDGEAILCHLDFRGIRAAAGILA
jgi:hypothetical protein